MEIFLEIVIYRPRYICARYTVTDGDKYLMLVENTNPEQLLLNEKIGAYYLKSYQVCFHKKNLYVHTFLY